MSAEDTKWIKAFSQNQDKNTQSFGMNSHLPNLGMQNKRVLAIAAIIMSMF